MLRLFALFVVIGLVAQPVATQAARGHVSIALSTEVAGASADMPCCPEDQNTNGCKQCPLANCTLQLAQDQLSQASGVAIRRATRRVLQAQNDLIADGLIGAPPDHPPRTST